MGTVDADGTGLKAYRAILAIPGVGALTAVSFLARLPASAAAITLTLHVVLTLDQGYAAAGVVGAAATVGMAIGAPLLGRLVDRRGLRTMLTLTLSAQAVFWTVAPLLPYPALLVGALAGGVLGVPVYSITRQSLAVLVPADRRRPAFALDSMSVEISYIVGPAVGALLALQVSSTAAMWTVGAGWLVAGGALMLLNPPTRIEEAAGEAAPPPPVRQWLDLRLIGALLATTAAVLVVFGTELSMIAGLQLGGNAGWIPLVNTVWCVASLIGGFVYGAARRSRSLPLLVGCLGAAALPVALAGSWWSYALLLVPVGLLIAPSMAASAETVSALTPEHVRGLVTGFHGSAITIGAAVATPLAGLLVDVASPAVAVLTVGSAGLGAAILVGLLARLAPVTPSADSQAI
ncbi:putative MFS family arabinose efflux permease [Pseudonocardia cypriaca]|uniref:Putative MFS family arabinose efflux permease n=2 Tax=Pseudonocardia cypriaca TaxID=882449 RepID=A0A543FRB1_9PSEU|nr:putative MFS family arabinose efflux permease [Pseudonocardia cypriaca]